MAAAALALCGHSDIILYVFTLRRVICPCFHGGQQVDVSKEGCFSHFNVDKNILVRHLRYLLDSFSYHIAAYIRRRIEHLSGKKNTDN